MPPSPLARGGAVRLDLVPSGELLLVVQALVVVLLGGLRRDRHAPCKIEMQAGFCRRSARELYDRYFDWLCPLYRPHQ